MKKTISLIGIIVILLSMTMTTFAGSIPEDLLHSGEAQIFFAEVIEAYQSNGDEITLATLLETEIENCSEVEFLVNSHFGGFEVDKTKFYDIANEIRLIDVENILVMDADAGLHIRCYEGNEVHEITIWDNCTIAGSRVAMHSAPTGDYIIKAEDFNELLTLLPEEAQPTLPPHKSLYANFMYWFIYNSTTAYIIGTAIFVALAGIIVMLIRRRKKMKSK